MVRYKVVYLQAVKDINEDKGRYIRRVDVGFVWDLVLVSTLKVNKEKKIHYNE
jgi:hypothetical protein